MGVVALLNQNRSTLFNQPHWPYPPAFCVVRGGMRSNDARNDDERGNEIARPSLLSLLQACPRP
jgi:hypothetical protein